MIFQNGEYKVDPPQGHTPNLVPSVPIPFLNRESIFSRYTPSSVSPSRSPQKRVLLTCLLSGHLLLSYLSPVSLSPRSGVGSVPPLSTDRGTLHHCWQGKIPAWRVPLFRSPRPAFLLSSALRRAEGEVRVKREVAACGNARKSRWALPHSPGFFPSGGAS